MMNATERMQKMLAANPAQLSRIDAILDGSDTRPASAERENRLLTHTDAAKRLGVSRSTVYQLVRSGKLETVPLLGSTRVTLESVNAFARGRACA